MKRYGLLIALLIMMAALPASAEFVEAGITYTELTETTVGVVSVENLTEVVIPDEVNGFTVTEICNKAFYGSSIKTVTLPKNLLKIGDEAFEACLNLTEVVIPTR